jgi:hypothetical protein
MRPIRQLLDEIENMSLVLPEFQREYVWLPEQAKQLMTSLYKEYPTGALLFWQTAEPPEIKNAPGFEAGKGLTEVILDGQQRLTTLYLLTRGVVPPYYTEAEVQSDPRNLYFNLEDGEFQYFQAIRMESNPAWLPVVACFTKRGDVRPTAIAKQKSDDPEEQMRLTDLYHGNLNRLLSISDRQVPIQTVPASANVDNAIDVFDRVNSLGTKLSDAELALAHITGKWPQARRVMKAKIDEMSSKRFSVDLAFMVRSLVGVSLGRGLFDRIHSTPRDQLEPSWATLTRILDYLVNVLPGRAAIHSTDDLPTNNVLVPVVVYLAQHGPSFKTEEDLRRCIHWLYAASMWARFTSQTDNRIDHDIAIVLRSPNPWPELLDAIIDQRGRIEIKTSDLEGRSIQHPFYRMAYVTIKANRAIDWFNGSSLDQSHGRDYQIHSHLIFPRTALYGEGGYSADNHLHNKLVNEIANRAFLTSESDLSSASTHPEEYLAEIEARYPGALAKQLIPMDPRLWKLDRYPDFLVERRRLIADAINGLMEELLVPGGASLAPPSVSELIRIGESAALEFKSSLRWDLQQKQVNKTLEKVVAKSVAGFLNADGGTLLIGVADDGSVLGIEGDCQTLGRRDRDGFEQHLIQVLESHLGAENLHSVKFRFEAVGGRDVCAIEVRPSAKPIYVRAQAGREFFVRVGATTRPLDMQAAHEYIASHWQS